MQKKNLNPDKDIFIKVFNNEERSKYCAQLLNGKYVICDINDPEPWNDSKVYDQKPKDFTQYSLFPMKNIYNAEFKWLFYAVWEFSESEGAPAPADLHLAEGWYSVFPIFYNTIYLYNPPMLFQLNAQ